MAAEGFVFNINFIEKLILFVKATVNKNHQIFVMKNPQKIKFKNLKPRVTTIKTITIKFSVPAKQSAIFTGIRQRFYESLPTKTPRIPYARVSN